MQTIVRLAVAQRDSSATFAEVARKLIVVLWQVNYYKNKIDK